MGVTTRSRAAGLEASWSDIVETALAAVLDMSVALTGGWIDAGHMNLDLLRSRIRSFQGILGLCLPWLFLVKMNLD